jgi:hypothetical protein
VCYNLDLALNFKELDTLFEDSLVNKNYLIAILAAFATLIGCDIGGTGKAAISSAKVTQGNCGALTTAAPVCTVTLTYNTGGESGASFSVNYDPAQPTGQFTAVFSSCSLEGSGQQTCNVPVTYSKPANGRVVPQKGVFVLGGSKSDPPIQFSGQ